MSPTPQGGRERASFENAGGAARAVGPGWVQKP